MSHFLSLIRQLSLADDFLISYFIRPLHKPIDGGKAKNASCCQTVIVKAMIFYPWHKNCNPTSWMSSLLKRWHLPKYSDPSPGPGNGCCRNFSTISNASSHFTLSSFEQCNFKSDTITSWNPHPTTLNGEIWSWQEAYLQRSIRSHSGRFVPCPSQFLPPSNLLFSSKTFDKWFSNCLFASFFWIVSLQVQSSKISAFIHTNHILAHMLVRN